MRFAALIGFFLMFSTSLFAQTTDLLERNFAGTSKQATPQAAKADIQNQAATKVSEEVIRELIGDDRYNKNKSLIANKVIKLSARYIPFVKPSAITQEGEEFKMSVNMKVSLSDLKQLLQVNSLLNENDTIPVVLPVISFIDRVESRNYRWWQPQEKTQPFLVKQSRTLEEALRNSFQKSNFFVIKPVEAGLGANVPSSFQNERIAGEDSQFFAQYFNAPVVIDGQVLINKAEKGSGYRVEVRMTAIQVSNSRPIADVSRRYDVQGSFEGAVDKKIREVAEAVSSDLASQVFEAWQRGSVGTSVIRVTVTGKHTLPSMEVLKERIRSQLTQVKNIRERLVSSDSVSFEVDTVVSSTELASKLEALDVNGKKLVKVSEGREEIVLKLAQ
ncbi:hypothetical protein B9G69_014460 [Bdellovibrio sp. SKB1291214]|uniref:hypothetical protein n=1 Tax=Bdellovibrio sp. SKB1291214 TaxID=1732569 RepID=UPI000B51BFBB|nr:hypothetical protein [Bdellovibrio sp. SKB1291214]UYL08250.1 hypothetical protein B9G69_014460 [Bdellovibrio sp. SKB1291214]